MKKILIAAIAVFGFTTANAQYTAEKGDFQTSVNFTPFASDGNMFNNVGFNGTYFISDMHALRFGVNFGTESVDTQTTEKATKGKWGINVGYENHFKSYDRVDLYAGLQVGVNSGWEKAKEYVYDSNNNKSIVSYKKPNSTEISVAAFTGINFYVYKKLYVGSEIQFGYAHTSYGKGEYIDADGKVAKSTESAPGDNKIGFKVLPQLRLGWTF